MQHVAIYNHMAVHICPQPAQYNALQFIQVTTYFELVICNNFKSENLSLALFEYYNLQHAICFNQVWKCNNPIKLQFIKSQSLKIQ